MAAYKDARQAARMTPEDVAERLGYTRRQVRRWERGEAAPPELVITWLELLSGELGHLHPDWEGWVLGRDGRLWDGACDGWTPGQIRAMHFKCLNMVHLEARLRRPQQWRLFDPGCDEVLATAKRRHDDTL